MLKIFFVLAAVLLLNACAASYKVDDADDSATVTIKHALAVFPSSTIVNIFDNSDCENNDKSGRLAKVGNDTMIKNKALDVKVRAGETIFLASHIWKETGSERYGYLNFQCSNLISFTADKDTHYLFKAKALNNGECEIELLEQSSKLPPLDMQKLKSREACNKTGVLDF